VHINVGIGLPLMAVTVWLAAVVLAWPAGHPVAAAAVVAGYLLFPLAVQLLARGTDEGLDGRGHRGAR
jgi:hypothetical protein